MGARVEIIKRDVNEFGGVQFSQLNPAEVYQRTCAAKWCSWRGMVQVQLPPTGDDILTYRVYCGVHYIRFTIVTALSVGDPSPFSEAKRLALSMGVDWALVKNVSEVSIADPDHFACSKCAGGMIVETAGMLSGRRYVHTCGE